MSFTEFIEKVLRISPEDRAYLTDEDYDYAYYLYVRGEERKSQMTQDYIEKDNWKTIIGYADELVDFHKEYLFRLCVDAGPEGEMSEEDIKEIKVCEKLITDLNKFGVKLVECERQADGYYKIYSLIRK